MPHPYAQTIDELLSDSLIQAVMRADHVEPDSLKGVLVAAATRVDASRRLRPMIPESVWPRFSPERRALPAPVAALQLLAAGMAGGLRDGIVRLSSSR